MFLLSVPHDLHIVFPYIRNGFYIALALLAMYILFREIMKQRKENSYLRGTDSMIQLEPLNSQNKDALLQIRRDDIPAGFAPEIAATISAAENNAKSGLRGHCHAIKYNKKYVGIIYIGQPTAGQAALAGIKGQKHFRIHGFLIDSHYQRIGIGSSALQRAIDSMFSQYGPAIILRECHKDNQAAIRFYEKNGFVNSGVLNKNGTDYFMILE